MDSLLISLGGFILLLGLIVLGVPIAFAGAFAGVAGLLTIGGMDMTLHFLGTIPYSEVASYSYTTLPLYILLGEFAFFGGYAHGAYRTGKEWLGHLPGGLSIATVIGGAGFGAVCGASVASAAVLGKICIPEMKKLGYSDTLSTGSVAASANLASMIPPSGLMIVYSIFTEQSLNRLFIAGVVPGILITLLLSAMVFVRVSLNPSLAPNISSSSWGKRFASLRHSWGILLIATIVLGGIYTGIFTVTEAGAAGAFTAFLMVLPSKSMTWNNFKKIMLNSIRTTVMVLFIIVGIMIFTQFLILSRLPIIISSFIADLSVSRSLIMGMFLLFYLFLGMFFDAISMIALTMPIMFPAALTLGYDPIWFGVMVVLMCEIGLITPPVGINCYVVAGVSPDIPLETIFKGILPFVIINLLAAALLMAFPQLVLFLPNLMVQ